MRNPRAPPYLRTPLSLHVSLCFAALCHVTFLHPTACKQTDETSRPDDDSNSLTLPAEPPIPVRTTWTLLLYLTSAAEGCVGGETVFYPNDRKLAAEEISVPLETGMLLLHKHGDDCLLVRLSPTRCLFSPFTSLPGYIPSRSAGNWNSMLTIVRFLQHEGREVLDGEKWVVRTDLCIRK